MAEKPAGTKVEEEVDSVELPAPAGWKKFAPKNSDIPKRNDVLFISPTGEEIRNRKHLMLFLRSHPGGPSPSEFDWKFGGAPRRSARITEKKKVVETPEEGPKPHKRKSKSSDHGTKHQKNGGDTEKEEEDEVPENEKTDTQVAEGIADAEMKDVVEDSSIKENIEDEIEVKVADQDSAESQDANNNVNEPEKLQPGEPPITFALEETSDASEIEEELGVGEVGEGVPVLNEHEESKNGNSYVSVHHEVSQTESSFVSEHGVKRGVEEGSNEAAVLFVPEVTRGENVVVRENRVDSKAFLNDSHNWEQKTVSSS